MNTRIATLSILLLSLSLGTAQADLPIGKFVGVDFDNGGDTPGSGSAGTGIYVVTGVADGGGGDGTAITTVEALSPTLTLATDGSTLTNGGVDISFEITTVSPTNMRFGEMGDAMIGFQDDDPSHDFGPLPFLDETTTNDGFFSNGAIAITFGNLGANNSFNVYALNASTSGGAPNNNLINVAVGGSEVAGGALEANGAGVLTPVLLSEVTSGSGGELTVTITDESNPISATGFFGLAGVFIEAIGNVVPGDVDGDGDVDETDYSFIRDNFRLTGATKLQGDISGPDGTRDTVVNFYDFIAWQDNFPTPGGGAFAGFETASIPEPASITLLCLLGICAGGNVLRKRCCAK